MFQKLDAHTVEGMFQDFLQKVVKYMRYIVLFLNNSAVMEMDTDEPFLTVATRERIALPGNSDSSNETQEAPVQTLESFQLTPWRFAVAGAVFLNIVANNLQYSSYGSVTSTVAARYNTSTGTITGQALWNSAAFIPAVYPTMWLLDTHGIRYGLLVAAFLNTTGALLRWLTFAVPGKVPLLYVGSIVAGLGASPCMDASTKTAAHWFPESQRLTANAFMSLGTPIGSAVGSLLGPLIVNNDPSNVDAFNMVIFVATAVLSLSAVFVRKSKPANPPSPSASKPLLPFRAGIATITRNLSFWVLAWVYAAILGGMATVTTFTSSYIQPYGYSESVAGNLGVTIVASGIFASLVVSLVNDRLKMHRAALKVLACTFLLGNVLFFLGAIDSNRSWMLYLGCALGGAGGLPVVGLAYELGVECSFPVAEATSTGVLNLASQVLLVIMIPVTNALMDPVDGTLERGLIMNVVVAASAVMAVFFYLAVNRRIELEKEYFAMEKAGRKPEDEGRVEVEGVLV
ncbi:major facilitator superfamily domain-containing protein [Chytriomyces sp. MP71]|nr:major facilitator superfamily domain-containing protein [Chytriomyces sp. MP71]